MIRRISILFLFLAALQVQAQTLRHTRDANVQKESKTYKHYTEQLARLVQQRDSAIHNPGVSKAPSAYAYRIFVPATLYNSALMRLFSPDSVMLRDTSLAISRVADDMLVRLYAEHPEKVRQADSRMNKAGTLRQDVEKSLKSDVSLAAKVKNVNLGPELDGDVVLVTRKPNFWKFKGSVSLQFTQNYVTDNWYQGGESNYSGLAMANLHLNYDNKQRIQWENQLELQLGFQTNKSDAYHKVKATNNLIRLTSKFGYKAVSTLYYTGQLLTWTQLVPQYDNNSMNLRSEFLGPLYVNLSVGVDYKWNIKRFSGNIYLAPVSYNLRYISNADLWSKHGIPQGKHSLHDAGSSILINWKVDIWKNINWQSRMYFFTNYSYVNYEWENTINFVINRYLSTKLFLYPRIDTSRDFSNGVEGRSKHFMFKEWLSLSLNYNF
ncbi:MAG: DUF3078 domain-containing protein [Bacteroidaceae bacterium]|nr:DUF3078 domain-containing protein [Bacteroidaceae bacterium]